MNENASSNITQILTSIQNFLKIYDNPLWVKNATPEDIKTAFKLGNFIEKCMANFKSKGYLCEFWKLLEVWCRQKNIRIYDENFYALACDMLLGNFFRYNNIDETTLDIGVRVYTAIYSKERFKDFLKNLVTACSSLTAISSFVNSTVKDKKQLENRIILTHWGELAGAGQKSAVKSEVDTYLSLYRVEEMLPRVLGLLIIKEPLSENEKDVQMEVLDILLEKMLDRSILSKNFWLTLLKKVPASEISTVSKTHPTFLHSFMNFIEYLGSMLTKDSASVIPDWKSDPNFSLYPEISYFDILIVLKSVYRVEAEVSRYVMERLEGAKEHSNVSLWRELQANIVEDF